VKNRKRDCRMIADLPAELNMARNRTEGQGREGRDDLYKKEITREALKKSRSKGGFLTLF